MIRFEHLHLTNHTLSIPRERYHHIEGHFPSTLQGLVSAQPYSGFFGRVRPQVHFLGTLFVADLEIGAI